MQHVGSQFPDQGSNTSPLPWKRRVLKTGWLQKSCEFISIFTPHFLSQSSVDGHLHCLHVLAIVNRASVNIEVHVYFQIKVFVFPDIYAGEELLDHIVVLFLVFFPLALFLLFIYLFLIYLFYLFIFGCVGSSLLCKGFL